MQITLYSLKDIDAEKIKEFLQENKLIFKEITIEDKEFNEELDKLKRMTYIPRISFLKIVKNHSISLIISYNEFELNQLIEHINKYHPKLNN